MSDVSSTGAPQSSLGGECAARTIQRVSAVEACGAAAMRSISAVTPLSCAVSVSLREAT